MSVETISLLIALSAVLVGPFVSWKIAKKQISAQVISSNRQQWINDLRDTISKFLRDAKSIKAGYSGTALTTAEAFSRYEIMVLNLHRMELLVNPNKSDHAELIRLSKNTLEHVRVALSEINSGGTPTNDAERKKSLEAITPIAQKIFKLEWERVKSAS